MDNINQAFMRVYSKRRSNAKLAATVGAADNSNVATPTEGADRQSTPARPLQTSPSHGTWRVDSPATSTAKREHRLPAPHAAFASVQHVETYDLESIQEGESVSRVVLDDHMTSADPDAPKAESSDTSAAANRDSRTPRDAGAEDVPKQDEPPVTWVFELDVQLAGHDLEPEFNTRPIVALDAPIELDDAPREVRIALSVPPPTADIAPQGQTVLTAAVQDAPAPEPIDREVEPSTDDVGSASAETPILRMAGTEESEASPSADAAKRPLDDAQSPEQLNQPAVEMDAAPSVPFPEPEWASDQLATHSVIAAVEPTAEPFSPAWEVDQFHWPEVCTRLEQILDEAFQQSGEALYEATRNELRVLGVTSAERREGRTTLALTLARSAARAGTRVALLDADTANPDVARQLGIEAPCSWVDAASDAQPLSEAAVLSLEDNITLLPLITPVDDISRRLVDSQLTATLRQARQEFDLVIMDMHPIDDRDTDAFQQLEECPIDMAIVIRNINTTPKDETLQTVARLHAMGVPAVGVAENFTPNRAT